MMLACEDGGCVTLQSTLGHNEHEYLALEATLERKEREYLALEATLERKEHEHLELQAMLERRVEERTARLLEANEQIASEFGARAKMELDLRQAQRLEGGGRPPAGLAHEINTPVQFVSDSLAFIHDGIAELLQLSERL